MKKSGTFDPSVHHPMMERAMTMSIPKMDRTHKNRVSPVSDLSFSSPNKENMVPRTYRDTWSFGIPRPSLESRGCCPPADLEELISSSHEEVSTITSDTALKTTPELIGAHLDAAISNLGEQLSEPIGNQPSSEEIDLRLLELEREQAAAQTLLELQKICCLELPPQQWRVPTQRHLYSIPVESAHSLPHVLNGETPVKPQLFIGCTVPLVPESRVGVMTRAQTRIGRAQTTFGGTDMMECQM